MRVGIDSLLSSISAFSTDLNRIQTPRILFRDFRADKTFTTRRSGHTAVAEFKFEPLPVIQQSLPKAIAIEAIPAKSWKGKFDCWINGRALGAALRHSLGGSDGRAQKQAFPSRRPGSRCGQLPACLRKNC